MSKVDWFVAGVLILAGVLTPVLWNLLFSDSSVESDWPVVAESLFSSPDESWRVVTSVGWSNGNPDVPNYKNEIHDGTFQFLFDLRAGRRGGTFWTRSDEFVLADPTNFYFQVDVQMEEPAGIYYPEYGFFIEDPFENRVWQFYLEGEDGWEICCRDDFLPETSYDKDETRIGSGVNQLSILARGESLTFAINDAIVYTTRSTIPADSRINLYMGARNASRSIFRVSFDNAVLRSPAP